MYYSIATAATIVYQLVQRARQNLSDIPKSHKEDYGDPKKAYLYNSFLRLLIVLNKSLFLPLKIANKQLFNFSSCFAIAVNHTGSFNTLDFMR